MRKVTRETADAFIARKPKRVSNTETDGDTLYLFGNRIAWRDGDRYCLTLAGWNTVTTRDRLDGLLDRLGSSWKVSTKQGQAHLYNYRTGKRINVGTRETIHVTLEGEVIEVR